MGVRHKVLIYILYIEHHSVRSLVRIGLGLPQPLSRKASVPSPRTKGWGGTLACGLGVAGIPIPTTGEKA
jgi:hypothetical protein